MSECPECLSICVVSAWAAKFYDCQINAKPMADALSGNLLYFTAMRGFWFRFGVARGRFTWVAFCCLSCLCLGIVSPVSLQIKQPDHNDFDSDCESGLIYNNGGQCGCRRREIYIVKRQSIRYAIYHYDRRAAAAIAPVEWLGAREL